MKKNSIYIIILIIILITLILPVSCGKIFDEDQERKEQKTGSFSAVSIKGIYNIILIQDSTDKLVLTGKANIRSINAEVINDTLVISNRTFSLEPARNTMELHFSNISYLITHHPVSIVTTDTLKADTFAYFAEGEIEEADLKVKCNYLILFGGHNTLGNFHISGYSKFADLSVRYGASMDARGLICSDAEVYNSSVGDIYVNVSRSFKAYIAGTGNIFYYGNPAVEVVEKTGEGRIVALSSSSTGSTGN